MPRVAYHRASYGAAPSPPTPSGPTIIDANCQATDAIGMFVYISGNIVGGLYRVTKADPTNGTKMPAVGAIISKTSPTICKVQLSGPCASVWSGLSAGRPYYVGLNALPSLVRPGGPPRKYTQAVGVALDASVLFLQPSFDLVVLVT